MPVLLGDRVKVYVSTLTADQRNAFLYQTGVVVEIDDEEFIRVAWDTACTARPWAHVKQVDVLSPRYSKEELLTHPDKEVRVIATKL